MLEISGIFNSGKTEDCRADEGLDGVFCSLMDPSGSKLDELAQDRFSVREISHREKLAPIFHFTVVRRLTTRSGLSDPYCIHHDTYISHTCIYSYT